MLRIYTKYAEQTSCKQGNQQWILFKKSPGQLYRAHSIVTGSTVIPPALMLSSSAHEKLAMPHHQYRDLATPYREWALPDSRQQEAWATHGEVQSGDRSSGGAGWQHLREL